MLCGKQRSIRQGVTTDFTIPDSGVISKESAENNYWNRQTQRAHGGWPWALASLLTDRYSFQSSAAWSLAGPSWWSRSTAVTQ